MNNIGLSGNLYRPLSKINLKKIHESSLQVLEEVGVYVNLGSAIKILKNGGANYSSKDSRVRFDHKLVEKFLKYAPSQVILYGRDNHDLILKDEKVYLGTGGAAIYILDSDSGQCRETTLSDMYNISRLIDKLDNIHFLVRPCVPRDIPAELQDINQFYACLAGTGKHVMAGVSGVDKLEDVILLASYLAGNEDNLRKKPFISFITSWMISPLRFSSKVTEVLISICQHGLPVALSSAPMTGSTSPITMAGTLVQLHAEELAGIVFTQMIREGTPVLYGGIPSGANFMNMGYAGGMVECGMMNAAITQLAHLVGIPNYNSAGLTDSKLGDIQAGYEKAQTILLAAMAGSNYIHHSAGMLESMLTVAYEQYVIDNDIIGNALRILRGIEVNSETLALEVIKEASDAGNYLGCEHTTQHLRNEFFLSSLADRNSRQTWDSSGSKDMWERAKDKVKEILNIKSRHYIPDEVDKTIRKKFEIKLKRNIYE